MDSRYVSFIIVILTDLFIVHSAVTGQGVVCNPFICAENAECVDQQCSCTSGFTGWGRIICVPTDQCPCLVFGDPHIRQFDRNWIHTVLPCQFSLAEFTTLSGCTVTVELVTYHRPHQKYPLRAFSEITKVKVTRDNTMLEFSLGPSGLSPSSPVAATDPSLPDSIPGIDVTVVRSSFNTYTLATLPKCDNTVITYDPVMLTASISTPRAATFPTRGLCGNCNGNAMDDNVFLTLGRSAQEASFAFSLRQLSVEQSTNDSTSCRAIRTAANSCSDQRLVKAVQCCGVLYASEFASCLERTDSVTRVDLLRITKECLSFYCVENRPDVAGVFVPVMIQLYGCSSLVANYVCPR